MYCQGNTTEVASGFLTDLCEINHFLSSRQCCYCTSTFTMMFVYLPKQLGGGHR